MSLIATDPGVQAQELTKNVGEEISRMIAHQKQLEQRFQTLTAAQPALRAMANKANLKHNQAELQEVSEALRQATKNLCRNLQVCDIHAKGVKDGIEGRRGSNNRRFKVPTCVLVSSGTPVI